ncbi:unnamed protein product [Somion occarium]|uniref:Enoyl reductase (ER) domain-containing protein n=1 Tax=Somion occarium TaxID=3059160 RepID=A0ABP1ED82_9APHY
MTLPTKHKALVLKAQNDLSIETFDVYHPEAGELLVRVEAVALNPADWKLRDRGFQRYPTVLGLDAAGVVVAVGDGVKSTAVGDKIFYAGYLSDLSLGTFQQYNKTRPEFASKAATIPLALTTAATGLYGKVQPSGGAGLTPSWTPEGRGKYAGQPLVVFGGSSSVGQYAIQLAKLSGFSPIITTVSSYNVELVKSLGATHTIDRHLSSREIANEVKKITSEPVKVIYDAISLSETQDAAYDVLASGGILIIVLGAKVDKDKITPDKKIIGTHGSCYSPVNRELGISLCSHLTELVASGDIKPNASEVVPGGLTSISKALDRLANNAISGKKLVVHPSETV